MRNTDGTSMFLLPPVPQLEIKTPFLNYSGCLLLSYNSSIQCVMLLLLKDTKSAVAQWRTEIGVTFIPFPSAYATKQVIHPDSLSVSKRMLRRYFTHFQEVRYWSSPLAAEFVNSNDGEGTPCCILPLDSSSEKIRLLFFTCHGHASRHLTLEVLVFC